MPSSEPSSSLRLALGRLVLVLSLLAPFAAAAQQRTDTPAPPMKTHVAPPTSAPASTLPAMPPALIVPRDRSVIQSFYVAQSRTAACAPGATRRDVSCPTAAPPSAGVAAQPGPLPAGTVIMPLPRNLLERLTLAPTGYAYGLVDRSVVLYAISDRRVVDSAPAY